MMPILRFVRPVALGTAIVLGGCGEPTASGGASTFTAQVRGTTNERLTGSATASFGGDWLRQHALSITLPNGTTFSGVALSASNGTTISFFRPGTDLPVGTYAVGTVGGAPAFPKGGFSGGYVVRRTDGLQLFLADSGSLTIAQTGSRVSGTFTLHAKHFDVIPLPSPDNVGKPITPLSSGDSPLTVSGSFDAARR
jgi:hypothetical protein